MDRIHLKNVNVIALGSVGYYYAAFLALPWTSVLACCSPARLQLANAALLLVVSIPFALALASSRLSLRNPVLLALAVSFLALVLPALPHFEELVTRPGWSGVSAALDYIKFAGTLPLVTWLVRRWLPLNDSSEPKPLRGSA
ncbi:MAG: hypothetical protein ACOH1P_02165 [Lysobacter sp.]